MVKTCESNEKIIKMLMKAVGAICVTIGVLLLASPPWPFWQAVMRSMGDADGVVTVVTPLLVVFGLLFVFLGILFLIRFRSRSGIG